MGAPVDIDAVGTRGARAGRVSQLDALIAFVNNAPIAAAVTDRELRFLAISPIWMADLDLPVEALLGRSSYDAAPETRRYAAQHQRVLAGETLQGQPDRLVLPNGEERWMSWSASPWRDDDGEIGGMMLVSHNVTAQVEAESDARRSRALNSIIVEHCPLPMVVKAANGRVLVMNQAMQKLYGVAEADHRGLTVHEVMDPALARAVAEEDRHVLESGEAMVVEECRGLPGIEGDRVIRKTKAAIRDADGAAYIVAISEDVTETRRTQEALETTRAFLERVIDNIPVGLTVKSARDRRLLLANQAVADIFGFKDAQDNLGRTNEDVFSAPQAERLSEREFELIRNGGSRFYEGDPIETQSGGIRYINQLKTLVADADPEADGYILTITEDVTERLLAQGALKEALARAEAASVAKSEFLANMSHEIRTPLNGVLGLADALSRMELTAQQRGIVEMIVSSGQALTGILSDVLDLAKAESGQLELSRESFSLRETIGSAAFLFETVARDKGVEFKVEFDSKGPDRLAGDPLRIRQVVSNLISNAVKFTSEGEVRISVASRVAPDGSAHICVKVKDTGPGFSEEVRARLFSRFEQGDGSITRRYGGTGLGLSIASALAQKMGGRIDCRAKPGAGATFIFQARVELADAALAEAADRHGVAPRGLDQRPRVLLAEDHHVNQKVVQLMLADMADLVIVDDGRQAVEQVLGSGGFDVVLMDTQMPVMDGLTAIKSIRAEELRRGLVRTPIISLTANAMAHQVSAALEAGADHHLPKPITVDALCGAIQLMLDHRAMPDQIAVA